jgi:acyl-[acyl-carrier-protein]-phospholipid O-acyltransferase / long-chain-fatty-acid--[acyl-carrier-protein] ligase
MLKEILRGLLKCCYKVELQGLEHYTAAGKRVLIVANHLSILDAIIIGAFLPEKLMFAVNSYVAKRWYLKLVKPLCELFPIDPSTPMSTKSIINEIKKDRKCVIFPEGRITVTGSLMKIYEGPGLIADKAQAKILPVRIEGAQYTPFSFLKGKVRIRWFPKITLTVLEPRDFKISDTVKGKQRRYLAGLKLYDLMTTILFDSSPYQITLFQSLIDQAHLHGKKHIILEDISRKPIQYGAFLKRSFALGYAMAQKTKRSEYVGVILPNMISTAITFFALQAYGRVPAMINFSTGLRVVLLACKTAEIKTIYTSKQFIESAHLNEMILGIQKENIQVLYLEDVVKDISFFRKMMSLIAHYIPQCFYQSSNPKDPAVMLFTSGSEGTPKGVLLSHINIQANRYQLAARVDFGPTDIIFNALPMFHSFGLTAGTLLPVLAGIKTFLYPAPLHYRVIPELVYDTNATIMFGTDTFLAGYARFANPYDFYSIRYIFSGAEKLKKETQNLWTERFGVRLFEGYGATETAPVLSTNTPMHYKSGTVGRFLPGIQYSLQKIEGISEGGRLIVTGPNIMMGYVLYDQPGVLLPLKEGAYDTGDIVSIDEEGYIKILGRVKRFAKIAGEMVSLTSVENYLSHLWPDDQHAVISRPDPTKGEVLHLITTCAQGRREEIIRYIKEHHIGELYVPKHIEIVDALPILGTGKIDYVALQESINLKEN